MFSRWSAYVLLGLFASWPSVATAGDMDRYKRFANTDNYASECDGDDKGSQQVSCRYTEVGVISGAVGLFSEKTKRDPRWPKLEKYWDSAPDNYLKFTAVACARAGLDEEARRTARARAKRFVELLIRKYEQVWFTGLLKAVGYRKNDGGYKCVSVANTQGKRPKLATKQPDQNPTSDSSPEPEPYVALPPKRRNVATFIIHNNDRYKIGLSFYSQTRRNHAWPGGNQQYNLSGSYTYELNCRPGEKICYGAWRDYQSYYWGAGNGGHEACQRCCTTCGSTLEATLNDAGPDSYANTTSSGPSVNDVLDAFTGVLNGIQRTAPTYQQRTYTQPTYRRRNNQRGSDITGTR